jgi:hypothetical protein
LTTFEVIFPKEGIRDIAIATAAGIGIALVLLVALPADSKAVKAADPTVSGAAMVTELGHEFDLFGFDAADGHLGVSGQLPETHPMHFFQLNPSSRMAEIEATPGHDFFVRELPSVADAPGCDGCIDASGGTVQSFQLEAANFSQDRAEELHIIVPGNLWFDYEGAAKIKLMSPKDTEIVIWVSGNVYIETNIITDDLRLVLIAQDHIFHGERRSIDGGDIVIGNPNGREGALRLDAHLIASGKTQVH